MNKKDSSKNNKHKKHKHYTVLPYFKNALIYVLVSIVVISPMLVGIMARSVKTVHRAQETMTMGYNELQLDKSMEQRNATNYVDDIKLGKMLGTIICPDAGINEPVYYGVNRVALRDGVGFDRSSYLFGEGGWSRVAGYPSSSFKNIDRLVVGDIITVETYWGRFRYKVTEIMLETTYTEEQDDTLVLAVYSSTDAFSAQSDKCNYAVATLIDKEVQ